MKQKIALAITAMPQKDVWIHAEYGVEWDDDERDREKAWTAVSAFVRKKLHEELVNQVVKPGVKPRPQEKVNGLESLPWKPFSGDRKRKCNVGEAGGIYVKNKSLTEAHFKLIDDLWERCDLAKGRATVSMGGVDFTVSFNKDYVNRHLADEKQERRY